MVRQDPGRPNFDARTLALRYVVRRVPQVALGATCAVCATVVWLSGARLASTEDLIPVIRVASVLFAAAAGTCLEDPSAEVFDATSFGRLRRRALTVLLTAAAAFVLWSIVIVGAVIIDRNAAGGGLPVAGLAVELGAMCCFGWLVAAALLWDGAWRGTGTRTAAVVVVASVLTLGHPSSMEWLWAPPGPAWRTAHELWVVIGVLAALGSLALSRDPAGRSRMGSRDRTRTCRGNGR